MKIRKNYEYESKKEALASTQEEEETELGRKGTAMLGSTSWLPLEKRHLHKAMRVWWSKEEETGTSEMGQVHLAYKAKKTVAPG